MKQLIVIITIVFLGSCGRSRPERELYLIPEGYTGIQWIVFGREDGLQAEYGQGGRRIYRFDSTGILMTQFPPNPGGFSRGMRQFFYVNEKGKKLKQLNYMTLFATHHKLFINDTINFHPDSIGVFSLGTNSCDILPCQAPPGCFCMAFIVDTFKNQTRRYPSLEEIFYRNHPKPDSLE